jgi:AcrR family transcriptional regulator
MIALKGLDALTLKDLAEPVGIKVPSIYAHFSSREDVLKAVADRYVAALAQQFPFDEGDDPMHALLAGTRGLVIYFAAHPAHARLKLRDLETPGGRPELSAAAEGLPVENIEKGPLHQFFARLERLVESGIAAGQFRKVTSIDLYRVAFGTTLLSLTWPTQDIFTSARHSQEISHILPMVEEAVRSFVAAR